MAVAVATLGLPARVDQVTIDNPHPWLVNVDVTGSDRDGRLGIGTVSRNSEKSFTGIIDQGDT